MTFSNNMYLSKINLTALEPMEGNAGDRRRVAIDQPDRDKMDQWMSQDLEQVRPNDLQLMVGAILVENTVARGTHCFQQIRRRYVNIEVDEEGKKVVRVKGNVARKTLPGRAADYEPLNVVIQEEQEVKTIEKLMSHLPSLGCPRCAFADPPKRMALDDGCACDDLFLNPLTDQQWQRNKGTWFRRQRRGRDWFTSVLSEISKKAG